MFFSQSPHASDPHFAWRVAHPHHDDYENDLIDCAPTRGESGAIAPRTMALFAIGFVLGAVAIGSMGIAISPVDPPAVRPIELRSPDERDGRSDGAERRRDRLEPRRGSERRDRSRPRAPAVPARPQSRQQPPAQNAPPAAAPRSRTPAPRPKPAPRPRSQPQPAPAAPGPPQPAQPAPPAPAPPPADDDEDGGDDPSGDDDADEDDAGEPGELDDDG
jgi:hypothetical protein